MKTIFLLFFVVVTIVRGGENQEGPKCQTVRNKNGQYYKLDVVARGLNRPYQLAWFKKQERFYFSFNVGTDDKDTFNIGYTEKNHSTHKVLENVVNGFAIAINNVNNTIYFGGSEGVYRMHAHEEEPAVIISGYNVWDMFYHKHLYFIDYPGQRLYKHYTPKGDTEPVTERVEEIHENIFQFAVEKNGNMYITNSTGLFKIKSGSKKRIFYRGPTSFRAIEVNNVGKAHFAAPDGVYVAQDEQRALADVVHRPNVFGLTFDDDDHIVYSDPHEIVRLIPGKC